MAEKKTTRKRTATTKIKSVSSRRTITERQPIGTSFDVTPSEMKEPTERKPFAKTWKYALVGVIVIALVALAVWKKEWFVVAIINGKPITRIELANRLIHQNGQAALTTMINERLIEDQAAQKHITISDKDINDRIDQIKKTLPAGLTIDQALASQNLKMEELRKQLRLQLMLEKILADKIAVNDDEVKKYMQDNQSSLPATDSATQANVARDALKQQKEQQAFQDWMSQATRDAKIQKFL